MTGWRPAWGCYVVIVASWMAAAGVVSAQPTPTLAPLLPVEAYSAFRHMTGVDLSPDGSHVAFMVPHKGRMHVLVRKLMAGPDEKPTVIEPSDGEIVGFDWFNNERLLVRVMMTDKVQVGTKLGNRNMPLRFSRTIAINRDLSNQKVLLDRPPNGGRYYLTNSPILQYVDDQHVLAAFPTGDGPERGVVKVNVNTGSVTKVQRALPRVWDYVPDPTGEIRIALTYDDKDEETTYLWRQPGGSLQVLRKQDAHAAASFSVLGFSADGKDLYVASRHEGDREAIYRYDLENDRFLDKIAEDLRYDVGDAILHNGAVVAIAWTDDLAARRWLDPKVQALQEALDKAVPDSREIILDTAADGRLVLVASLSMMAPTTYRLFDHQTRQFTLIGDTFPSVPQDAVAEQRPVRFKARDGLDLSGYLTLPLGSDGRNLPFILLPHGGPYARDTGDFDVLVQFLANRGYAVLQPNFRGSTGFGRAFHKAGERQWGGLMQDDLTDAVGWAVAQGIADPKRMCIVGWSYGGYAALMAAVKTPDLFKCAVATAPIANMERFYEDFVYYNTTNFNRTVHVGDDESKMRDISPVHLADRVQVPVLLIHGDVDVQAPVQHSRDMNKALLEAEKPVEYIEIKNMDHTPLLTDQMVTILSAWERFLKAHIGGPGG